ncbi:hypothetical protein [Rhizobium sp. 768_B6_N1_8]|jgi:hypothetical protein
MHSLVGSDISHNRRYYRASIDSDRYPASKPAIFCSLSQSSYLAYIDVFHTLMWLSLAVLPLAFILRKIDLGEGSGHQGGR